MVKFRAAGDPSAPFRFVVMGDGRGSWNGINKDVLEGLLQNVKALSVQPEFILFLGDMVTGDTDVRNELTIWKSLVSKYYPANKFYTVLGNHENDENVFSSVFDYLPNNQLPGYQRTAYYFDYGNSRFIVLNSNRTSENGSYFIGADQRTWLESLLKDNGKTQNFVCFHVPAFPIGSHYGESLDGDDYERDALWAIIDKYNVSAVFVGHEHNYNRRMINSLFNSSYKNQIYQLNSAGAGAPIDSSMLDSRNVITGPLGLYHYMVADVVDRKITFSVFDWSNNKIDSFIVDKSVENPPDTGGEEILAHVNEEWKYLDNGTDQGTAWREGAFDDSKWKSGKAELGYGDGDESTLLGYGSDKNKKYITTYFRKALNLEDISAYKELTLKVRRDDGAVVYINGVEVFRTNMPAGTINYNTLAVAALSDSDEDTYHQTAVSTSLLVKGRNVVAVEVHQADKTSSDISFNLELIASKNPPPPPVLAAEVVTSVESLLRQYDDFDSSEWESTPSGDLIYYSQFKKTANRSRMTAKQPVRALGDGNWLTTYIKNTFTVPDPSIYKKLVIRVQKVDKVVVRLNDTVVLNLINDTAGQQDDGTYDWNFFEVEVNPEYIKSGSNVLAAKALQSNTDAKESWCRIELVGSRVV